MSKVALILGVFFIVIAVMVLLFANGPRRWYSGVFFAIIGTVTLLNALRKHRAQE